MLNYINLLINNLDGIKSKINTETNKYKLVELKAELEYVESKINYCIDLVVEAFSDDNFLEFAGKHIPAENFEKAKEEELHFNEIVIGGVIRQTQEQNQILLNNINEILEKNPNIENDEYKDTTEYTRVKNIRASIQRNEKLIVEKNKEKKTFFKFLSLNDKLEIVNKLLEHNVEDNLTIENLLKKAKEYRAKFDLLSDLRYPVGQRFKELTENKTDSLAIYLLENEEAINRLTMVSSTKSIETHYSKLVSPIERVMGDERVEEFNQAAKEKGISDLINKDTGQFYNKKVYFIDGNYERFTNCITEIKASDDIKGKIKKLLKKFDSLDILPGHAVAGELGMKEYGFFKFLAARKEFIESMNENPPNSEKIKNTLEALKKEEAKIFEMYALIKDELGDDYESMPSNVDSYRAPALPPCFKNNLVINAKFNSLFITLSYIKENNLDIDQFVDNPLKVANDCLNDFYEKNNLDTLLKDKTKGEAILFLSDDTSTNAKIDIIKCSRSFEVIIKSETNEEYVKENHISSVAFGTRSSDIDRCLGIGTEYFRRGKCEALQNIFAAKKDEEGRISYLDCYISPLAIQEDIRTGKMHDEKATIVEQISQDNNIENTFYEAIKAVKYFSENDRKHKNYKNLSFNRYEVFYALQEFAAKIILTHDLKGNSSDQQKGYSEKFVDDLFYVIEDYKKIDDLKGIKFKFDKNGLENIYDVVKHRKELVKTCETGMNNGQTPKEEHFIREFERINNEIDELDKQAERIGKRLGKGLTNKEIEDIAAEQRKKFIELEKLQNNRLKELKDDVKNNKISKFYFEQRSEQVKLLTNIKDKPAMFMCDDKNYKDFKTYVKKVLNKNIKEFNANELREQKEKHTLLINKSVEEKRLYLLNKVLKDNGLGRNKSINFDKVELIVVNENVEEMKKLSDERLISDQEIQTKKALLESQKLANDVAVNDAKKLVVEEVIEDKEIKAEIKEV